MLLALLLCCPPCEVPGHSTLCAALSRFPNWKEAESQLRIAEGVDTYLRDLLVCRPYSAHIIRPLIHRNDNIKRAWYMLDMAHRWEPYEWAMNELQEQLGEKFNSGTMPENMIWVLPVSK